MSARRDMRNQVGLSVAAGKLFAHRFHLQIAV
jgi:hypothetical protein